MSLYQQAVEESLNASTKAYLDMVAKGKSMTDAEAIEADNIFKKMSTLKTILNELNHGYKPRHCV